VGDILSHPNPDFEAGASANLANSPTRSEPESFDPEAGWWLESFDSRLTGVNLLVKVPETRFSADFNDISFLSTLADFSGTWCQEGMDRDASKGNLAPGDWDGAPRPQKPYGYK